MLMKKLSLLLLFVVHIFYSSCTKSLENQSAYSIVQLVPTDSLIIGIDASTPSFPAYIDFIKDENLLLVANEFTSALQFYDLRSKKLVKSVIFDKDGPHGIKNMGGIKYVNQDTIIIFDRPGYLKIVNLNGEVIFSRVPTTNYNLMTSSASRTYLFEGHLFSYNRGTFKLNENNFRKEPTHSIAISLSLKDSSTNDWLTYPETILKDQWDAQQLWFYNTINEKDNVLIYANAASDSINIFHDASLNHKNQFFGAKLLPKPKPFRYDKLGQLSSADATEMKNWFITQGSAYGAIHFDPFRELYYRFIYLPNLTGIALAEKPLALIVADKNFKVIGEFIFDEKYNQQLQAGPVIITEKGIHIFVNDYKEDYWKWYVFNPIGN
jgi:hypothetical protein